MSNQSPSQYSASAAAPPRLHPIDFDMDIDIIELRRICDILNKRRTRDEYHRRLMCKIDELLGFKRRTCAELRRIYRGERGWDTNLNGYTRAKLEEDLTDLVLDRLVGYVYFR